MRPGNGAHGNMWFSWVSNFLVSTPSVSIKKPVSQKNDGLTNVSSNVHQHYLFTIISSLVMLSIGMLMYVGGDIRQSIVLLRDTQCNLQGRNK
jgi:hypothetical protein